MATTSNDPMFAEDLSAEQRRAEADYFARMDAAEAYGAYIERMAEERGDEPSDDWDVPAALTRAHDAPYNCDPVPPAPAAPNVVPFRRRLFDRAAHCQAIAAGGGARTVALCGHQHMRTIGRAGARATIERHGLVTFAGIITAKGWTGPRRPDLLADLAVGRDLADLNRAAQSTPGGGGRPDRPTCPTMTEGAPAMTTRMKIGTAGHVAGYDLLILADRVSITDATGRTRHHTAPHHGTGVAELAARPSVRLGWGRFPSWQARALLAERCHTDLSSQNTPAC